MRRKTALVTGVSRLKGIGRAICRELARRDIDIYFSYWQAYDRQMPWGAAEDEPEIIQQELRKAGVRCEKLEMDLGVEGSEGVLLDKVESTLGPPSILINNATYSSPTSLESFSAVELDHHYAINLRATTLLTVEFIKRFEGDNGRIIYLTSGQSLGPMSNEIAYAVTKGAIETLTRTLSQKIAAQGITINAVNPGPNDTGWIDDQVRGDLLQKFPMKRIGTPTDTANLIGFLVSEEAGWITGQVIHSEGGFIR